MGAPKRIALVAHDNRKEELLAWAEVNLDVLSRHQLLATGTTGALLQLRLGVGVEKLLSGPLGGDMQLGALIAEGNIDALIFFWDPLTAQPHDPDVKALLRLAVLWNLPMACNAATADYIIRSPILDSDKPAQRPDYHTMQQERIETLMAAEGHPGS